MNLSKTVEYKYEAANAYDNAKYPLASASWKVAGGFAIFLFLLKLPNVFVENHEQKSNEYWGKIGICNEDAFCSHLFPNQKHYRFRLYRSRLAN